MDSEVNPLVSVIIPTYNRSAMLVRAIESVMNQTYRNFECIIVNDASTDDTDQILRKIKAERFQYFTHLKNRHVSAARNTGIGCARGDLIAFLDDDDIWNPGKLEKQVALIQSLDTEFGMVYCWLDIFKENKVIGEIHSRLRGNIFEQTLVRQPIGNSSTLLLRSTILKKVGGFDEKLIRGNDDDFIRRVCLHYKVDFVSEALVRYNVGHIRRITSDSLAGIRASLVRDEVCLRKFKDEFKKLPQIHARILRRISSHYVRLGQYSQVDELILESAKLDSWNYLWAFKLFLQLPIGVRKWIYRCYMNFLTFKKQLRYLCFIFRRKVFFWK